YQRSTLPLRTALAALLLVSFSSVSSRAQDHPTDPTERRNEYGSGIGFQILLTNSGFGLGGYYHRELTRSTSFMTEISFGSGKDARESKFFRFGSSYIPYKANYLLMAPVQAGIIHRLFRETVADNLRPYVQVTARPTIGWEYPYFEDTNGNGRYDSSEEETFDSIGALPKGDFRMGVGGTIALGAHFGLSKRVTQGVRIGYSLTHFFQGIQLMEPQVEGAQR